MSRFYDMDGNRIEGSVFDWARMVENADRIVKQEYIGGHFVSTVWLGVDHQYGDGPPLIFETMVFCKHGAPCDHDNDQRRYSTKEQALAGHAEVVDGLAVTA